MEKYQLLGKIILSKKLLAKNWWYYLQIMKIKSKLNKENREKTKKLKINKENQEKPEKINLFELYLSKVQSKFKNLENCRVVLDDDN